MIDTHSRLMKVATQIEAAAYNIGIPLVIPSDGVSLLGDQCRFYAVPAHNKHDLLEYLQRKYRLSRINPGEDAFLALNKLQNRGRAKIKGDLGLPSYADFSVGIGSGRIVLDFSLSALMGKDMFVPLFVQDLDLPAKDNIPIGQTLEGETVIYRPEDPRHCHVLIAGMTGAGKTSLANTILVGLVRAYRPAEIRIFMSSGKPEDITLWEGLPHLMAPPTCDPTEAFAMLTKLEEQRRARTKESKSNKPRLVMYLGEVSILCELNNRKFSDLLESLMRLGRSERISIIAATQRPVGDQVGSVLAKSQFPLVLCGRMANPQDSYLALGRGQTSAEYLPGRGAFITNNKVRFQAAFTADADQPEPVQRLAHALRAQFGPPDYVDLPDVPVEGMALALETDVQDVIEWLQRDEITEISINAIMLNQGWGFTRASRTFKRLEDMEIISKERNENRRAEVTLGKHLDS